MKYNYKWYNRPSFLIGMNIFIAITNGIFYIFNNSHLSLFSCVLAISTAIFIYGLS